MSTNPSPPAGLAQYGLAYLNIYPRFGNVEAAQAAGITVPAFNPALRAKRWSAPIPSGADPSDAFVAGDWVLSADKTAVAYHATGIAMSYADAAAVNIPPDVAPPSGDPVYQQPGYYLPEVPIPARNLVSGESLVMTPFGPLVNNSNVAQPVSAPDTTEAKILAQVNAIAHNFGLSVIA